MRVSLFLQQKEYTNDLSHYVSDFPVVFLEYKSFVDYYTRYITLPFQSMFLPILRFRLYSISLYVQCFNFFSVDNYFSSSTPFMNPVHLNL